MSVRSAACDAVRVVSHALREPGTWAGVVAALAVTAAMLVLRDAFGVPSTLELVGDRIASLLPIQLFLTLLTLVGGFNNLKALGVTGTLLGGLAAGGAAGLLYARISEHETGGQSAQETGQDAARSAPSAVSWRGVAVLTVCVGTWAVLVAALWSVLPAHFHGLPPDTARWTSALTLLGLCLAFVPLLLVAHHGLAAPVAAHRHGPDSTRGADGSTSHSAAEPGEAPRRGLLAAGGALALGTGAALLRLQQRATFHYDGMEYIGPDVQPITPNDRFYSVTKNVVDPTVNAGLWRLDVAGGTRESRTYSLGDVLALPAETQETTLMCISNRVGGGLMSNARWKGVPLARVLEAAGIGQDVKEVVLRAVDGYTDTIPIEKAMDTTTLLAFEMNGVALPARHGYPLRALVPGLFGEKSVKWLTRIELHTADRKGFYESQGWGPSFVIPTHSRFDVPTSKTSLRVGEAVQLKGVAFGGNRGVLRVEISTDAGRTWEAARLDYPGTALTWALWSHPWRPATAGMHRLAVRATDGSGALQTEAERETAPQGATGYHRVAVQVMA